SMPLFVECEGKIFPQWGLAFACALADADINRAVITDNRITIPSPNGDFVIPVRFHRSATTGRKIPYMADIPWWGSSKWETMYDWPELKETRNHLSMAFVWDLAQRRELIRKNNQ